MKALAITPVFVLLSLSLSGCVADMIAAERPQGSGTHRLIAGKPEDVREAFHRSIAQSNARQPASIPPYIVTDEQGMSEAVNTNHVAGATIIVRIKLYYAPGPKPGQTDAELVAEMPRGMDGPAYVQKYENETLDSITGLVAQIRTSRGEEDESAAAASGSQAPAQAPWWK